MAHIRARAHISHPFPTSGIRRKGEKKEKDQSDAVQKLHSAAEVPTTGTESVLGDVLGTFGVCGQRGGRGDGDDGRGDGDAFGDGDADDLVVVGWGARRGVAAGARDGWRSEERRVGKECPV